MEPMGSSGFQDFSRARMLVRGTWRIMGLSKYSSKYFNWGYK